MVDVLISETATAARAVSEIAKSTVEEIRHFYVIRISGSARRTLILANFTPRNHQLTPRRLRSAVAIDHSNVVDSHSVGRPHKRYLVPHLGDLSHSLFAYRARASWPASLFFFSS